MNYERPIAEIIDFAAENIMNSGNAGGGISGIDDGTSIKPPKGS